MGLFNPKDGAPRVNPWFPLHNPPSHKASTFIKTSMDRSADSSAPASRATSAEADDKSIPPCINAGSPAKADESSLTDCRKYVFSFFSLGILVFILYSNTFQASWHFDDEHNILTRDSVHLTEFSWTQIRETFYNDAGLLLRPVAYFSFAINYFFGKDHVLGYHLTNIFIHFLTASFLFLFLHRVLRLPLVREKYGKHAYFIAILSSVLWATNPVQTQAVTYIVQRMASMAGMFFIMSLFFYLHGRVASQKTVKTFSYSACVIAGLLACGTKENAAMLPFTIILFDVLLIQGLSKRNAVRILLIILFCLLFAQALMWITRGLSLFDLEKFLGGYARRNFNLLERLLTEPRVILFYISLLLYPIPSRLCIIHEPFISTGLFTPLTTFFSVLFILASLGTALAITKRHPLISFCILFFFLNHLTESSIFPLELVFEHRNYIPSMLLFVPISILILKASSAFSHKPSMYRIIIAFVILLIISNGHGTFIRNNIWKTEESIWMDAADKYPNSRRAYHNLAYYYDRTSQYNKAMTYYKQALKLPESSHGSKAQVILSNLGVLYEKTGHRKQAETHLRMAIEAVPKGNLFPDANLNLGTILLLESRYNEAMEILLIALNHDLKNSQLHHTLGVLLLKTDQPNEAIVELKKALELGGNQHKSLEYTALCYKEIGEYGKAVYYLQKAVSKKPDSVLTRLHLAECYLSIGKNATAKRILTEALSDIPPGLVFSEIQACAKKIVLRELPDKSSIMPLLEAYYSRKITEFEQAW